MLSLSTLRSGRLWSCRLWSDRLSGSKRSAFTLVELLVVIAILGLLAAILLPVFARVKESGRRSVCVSNLKQIGLALSQYTQDYDDRYPTLYFTWPDFDLRNTWLLCQPYIKNEQIFYCPSDEAATDCLSDSGCTSTGKEISYGFNMGPVYHENVGESMGGISGEFGKYELDGGIWYGYYIGAALPDVKLPSQTFLASDAYDGLFHSMDPTAYFHGEIPRTQSAFRHQNWRSVLFADGHAKSVQWLAGINDNDNPINGGGSVMLPRNANFYESYCIDPEKKVNYPADSNQLTRCGDIAAQVAKTARWFPER
jgi:prepilin-type N-terminal cleavage/methylation domain-containing protein/prepilin-type processing-associated H-X9-DG protein